MIVRDNASRALYEADIAADEAWSACTTKAALESRQREIRSKLLESIGGIPEGGDLRPVVTGRCQRDGYSVEKVVFEAEKGHHVTAHMFLPDPAKFPGRRPGILVTCGHSTNGKASMGYQRGSLQAAKRGMAVLIFDPVDQGERRQSRGDAARWTCAAHNEIGRRAELLGWSAARFRIRDGIRALDYLASRPEVDPSRLGVMGHSGGGTMSSWIMCLDDRIKCAAPSGFLSTMRGVCEDIGPQDAEQFVFGEIAFGFNHLGHIMLRAPSPVLLCSSHGDFFSILGTLETAHRAKRLYEAIGHAADFRLSDTIGPHHWHESTRTLAVDWMDWKLQGGPEPKDMQHYRNLQFGFGYDKVDVALGYEPRSLADMRTNRWEASVTETGCTLDLPGERTVYDIMKDEADRQAAARGELSPEKVREIAQIRPADRIKFTPVNGNVLVMEDATPVALHFAGEGENVLLVTDGSAPAPAMPGRRVVTADIRGYGENGAFKNKFYGAGGEELCMLYHLMGVKIVGKRAEDVIAAAKFVGGRPKLVAVGAAAIPAAHAIYTARELFSGIEVVGAPASWAQYIADDGLRGMFSNVVRGAFAFYDWPDLLRP